MQPTTAAVAKATGGAGATRTSLELAATLGRAGHAVAVLDVDVAERLVHVPTAGTAELVAVLVDHVDAVGRELTEGAVGRHLQCPPAAATSIGFQNGRLGCGTWTPTDINPCANRT